MAALGYVLGKINSMGGSVDLATAESLSLLIVALTACAVALSNLAKHDIPASVYATIGVLTLAIGAIGLMLVGLEALNLDTSIEEATALSELLIAVTACATILSLAKVSFTSGADAALGLISFVGILGTGLAAIGGVVEWMQSFCDVEGAITKGIDILCLIGNGIARFAGELISTFVESLFSKLPSLGDQLSDFSESASSFFDTMGSLDSGVLDGLGILVDISGKLTSNSIKEAVAKWANGGDSSLVTFGKNLSSFATPFSEFLAEVSATEFDSTRIKEACEALNYLAEVSISGADASQLSTFVNDVKDFAPAFIEFATTMQDLPDNTEDLIKKSAAMARVLSDLKDGLPKTGGLKQTILGEAGSLQTFGEELENFAPSFCKYAQTIATEMPDNYESIVQASASAAETLSTLQNGLPETGGKLQEWLGGTMDLTTFGKNIEDLGEALVNFAETTKDLDTDVIDTAVTCASTLSALQEGLPEGENKIVKWFKETSAESFSDSLTSLGNGISGFYESIKNTKATKIDSALSSFEKMGTILTNLSGLDWTGATSVTAAFNSFASCSIDDFVNAFEGASTRFESAGTNMVVSLQNGLNNGKESAVNAVSSLITSLATNIKSKNSTFSSKGREAMTYFAKGIGEGKSTITTRINNTLSDILKAFSTKNAEFQNAGKNIVNNISTGINNGASGPISKMKSVADNCLKQLNGYYNSYYNYGVNWVQGLANGINDKAYLAKNAAKSLAKAVAGSTSSALMIASPSKLARKYGGYWDEGLADGIVGSIALVDKASGMLTDSAIDGMSNMVESVIALCDADIDYEPTISPVLDLSNVSSGIAILNSDLSGTTFALANDITNDRLGNSISNTINANINDSNIISAIQGLRDDVSTLNEAVYNLKLYLDTGELVGGVAAKMDDALGARQILKARGV
jgi:hypothetical protein